MKRAFWLIVVTFGLFMGAAGAPSPLYEIFQREWRFSAATLTVIFAVYALSLLVALLVFGSLSDYLGRRPILLAALAIEAVSLVAFATAEDVSWLIVARILQGLATGLATSALSAALIDAEPKESPGLGPVMNAVVPLISLGVGAVLATLLVAYLPWPTHLVFWLLAAGCIAAGIGILLMSELVEGKPGWQRSLAPVVVVPAAARRTFLAMTPCLVAGWALAGLYLSLGPSVAAQLAHTHRGLLGGFVILALTGAGAATSALFRRQANDRLISIGTIVSSVGLCLTAYGVASSGSLLFLVGTILAGSGFGPAFTGAFRSIIGRSPADQRAGLAAAVYVVAYLSFGAPVVAAGIAASSVGLDPAFLVYAGAAVALYLVTLILHASQRRRRWEAAEA